MTELFSFEKLDAYKEAMLLVGEIYTLSDKFPSHEKYGLYSQLHRAIVSVPSNIAEACGRISYKEKIHFLEFAYGSLLEAYCQMQIAFQLSYISEDDFFKTKQTFSIVSRLISGLSKSYSKHV